MKIGAVIAEFNPLHNGHKYLIDKIKEEYGIDCLIVILSGNFTQRGNSSLINKFEKTKMSLASGADIVIELPIIYAISSAENFSYGAINILEQLNSFEKIDNIFFGTETNLEDLKKVSDVLMSKNYQNILKKNISVHKNLSFAKIRELTLKEILNIKLDFLNLPNNILAIEYLKQLKNISPIAIKRIGNYHDISFKTDIVNGQICSASAIRQNIDKDLSCFLPKESLEILNMNIEDKTIVKDLSCFEQIILYKIRTSSLEYLKNIAEVCDGLEYKLKSEACKTNNLNDLIFFIKSKKYTYNRISRILLYILLDVSKDLMVSSKNINPYIRVLGFSKIGKRYLDNLQKSLKNSKEDLVINYTAKNLEDTLSSSDSTVLKDMFSLDILASNVYTLGYSNPKKSLSNLDFVTKMIKKD